MSGLLLFHTEIDVDDMSVTVEEIHKPAHSIKCSLDDCLVCKRDIPACLNVRSPTWPAIIRVVLFTLQHEHPEKKYFNLKHDIYPFIVSHWKRLCPQKNILKWKKPMQDALSHGMSLFDSGKAVYGTGFWGLRLNADPWEVSEDDSYNSGRDNSDNDTGNNNSTLNFPLSSRKRRIDDDDDDDTLDKYDFHSLRELRDMAVSLGGRFKSLKESAILQDASYENMSDDFMNAVMTTQADIEREVENARHMWATLIANDCR